MEVERRVSGVEVRRISYLFKRRCEMKKLMYHAGAVAALLFCACELTPFSGGEVEESWLQIDGPADLRAIGSKDKELPLNGHYILATDITLDNWKSLASTKPFSGVFDGGGHTITIINGTGGLFNSIRGAVVRNLTVKMTATITGGNVGAIAGLAEQSVIENCAAVVTIVLTCVANNASAGGIVGTMADFSTVRNCVAQGGITLSRESGNDDNGINRQKIHAYSGGIAGYSGPPGQAGDGESGCLITGSRWAGGYVVAYGDYPYAGGIVGCNYTGSKVERCWAAGEINANGVYISYENGAGDAGGVPYAGGVAGFNSGYVMENPQVTALIENCYSTANVSAVSVSKVAFAGGIAGANANGAVISKCYARGEVGARVDGSGGTDTDGATGPMTAVNAGGIAGAQYFFMEIPVIEYCAALNPSVTGEDSKSGAAWNIYRVAGAGVPGSDAAIFRENRASSDMSVTPRSSWDVNGKDGQNCEAKPGQPVFADLGWDFSGIWKWSGEYPALR
jgi:hypothetical protein